ncbi:hypothetical protein D3C77_650090 [compost metagenome]
MGYIPKCANAAALTTWEPVGDGNERRAYAHPLEQAVKHHQCGKDPEGGAEPQTDVDDGTQHQATGHKHFGIGLIGQAAHHPFADAVGNQHATAQHADLRRTQIQMLFQVGRRKGEVVTHDVIGQVAQKDAQ